MAEMMANNFSTRNQRDKKPQRCQAMSHNQYHHTNGPDLKLPEDTKKNINTQGRTLRKPQQLEAHQFRVRIPTSSVPILLSHRITATVRNNMNQRDFTQNDGMLCNCLLFDSFITNKSRAPHSCTITFLDVRKTFDSISHS